MYMYIFRLVNNINKIKSIKAQTTVYRPRAQDASVLSPVRAMRA